MDDQLQRLLETEARAQAVIDAASRERQRMIEDALAAVRDAEARFEAGRAELRAPYLNEAKARADQAVAELARQYGERQRTCATWHRGTKPRPWMRPDPAARPRRMTFPRP
jgi:Tfp pilus assembly protein PilX